VWSLCHESASKFRYFNILSVIIMQLTREKLWWEVALKCRSRWSRGQRRMFAASWIQGSRVRIPLRAWMLVSCVCCELCRWRPLRRTDRSFRGVKPGVRVSNCVWFISLETRRPRHDLGSFATDSNLEMCYLGQAIAQGQSIFRGKSDSCKMISRVVYPALGTPNATLCSIPRIQST